MMSTFPTGYQHHHRTEQGPRAHQADAAGHHEAQGHAAWAVADGVGNHRDAPAAARRAVTTATMAAVATGDAVLGVNAARDALTAMHETDFDGDATLVLALATADGIDIAWAGDSRAYDLSGDVPVQLTVDHNAGTWLRQLGNDGPDDSHLFNRLTSHVRRGVIGHVHLSGPVQRLLLCTDGVHRVLEPVGHLAEAARRFRSRPDALTHRLMIGVRNCGPVDNATVMVIQQGR
jgi:serine/threonine protein phosphatase PrpC